MNIQAGLPRAGTRFWRGARPLWVALDRESCACLALALGCVVAGAGFSAVAPLILASLVDALVTGAPAGGGLVLAYAACLGLARAAGEGRTFFHGRAEQAILRVLTLRVARHLVSLPMGFFDRQRSGALVQTLENGLQGYRLLLQHGIFTLLPALLEMTLMAGIVAYVLDGRFLLVIAACAIGYGAVFSGGAQSVLAASRRVSAARIGVTAQLADSLRNIETVKACCGEAETTRRLDAGLIETRRSWQRFHLIRLRNGLLVTAIFSAGLLTVLALARGQVTGGAMTAGELVLVSAYMLQMVRPMELLGFAARDLGQGAAFIEKLVAILDLAPEAAEPSCGAAPLCQGMAVRLDRVCFSPEEGGDILRDVSLTLRPGARAGLVGPSGSGKSTLLRVLAGYCVPQAGEIMTDGVPGPARRAETAFIAQTPGIFNETVAYNAGFPGGEVEPGAVEAALARVGLAPLKDRVAGEGGAQLSGGERQRVAIARALLRRPRLVLADELTSALDPETEGRVLAELETAFAGATLVLASHRLRAVRDMDLILVLSEGQVVEIGTHDALLARDGVYASLWAAQEG